MLHFHHLLTASNSHLLWNLAQTLIRALTPHTKIIIPRDCQTALLLLVLSKVKICMKLGTSIVNLVLKGSMDTNGGNRIGWSIVTTLKGLHFVTIVKVHGQAIGTQLLSSLVHIHILDLV